MLQLGEPDVDQIMQKMALVEDLTMPEFRRAIRYHQAVLYSMEDTFLMGRTGFLGKEEFEQFPKRIAAVFNPPGARAAWEVLRVMHGNSFAAYVDNVLQQQSPRPIDADYVLWKETANAEKAKVA